MYHLAVKVLSTHPQAKPTMTTTRSCQMPRLPLTAMAAVTMVLCSTASAQTIDRVQLQDQDRMRRADVRASVSSFAHVDSHSVGERRSLSDEERIEMRRQIDEAIRKAYGRRHQERD